TDGIYIDGTQILTGDMSGPTSAQMVLKNPRVNYAVLETARGGLLRSGLGFDRCDIAVVTNVTSDHLGLQGVETLEELARVKAVVPQAVFRDGKSVLNADNEWTVKMARTARGEIIYFSMNEENPVVREHVRARGRAVVLRETRHGEMITIIEHRRDTSLLLVNQIPATFDGRNRANVANALAAVAAALGADVQLEHIRQALRGFTTKFDQTPGRFNLLEANGRTVLMDYCHNVGGLESMADFVKRMGAQSPLAVIAMPGDRSNEDIDAFGRLAGAVFQDIIIREDANRRGRQEGEVANLLRCAAIAGGLAESRIQIVLNELDAVKEAVTRQSANDFVVLMVDKPAAMWDELQRLTELRPIS
ncbi:MAG TPA: Mur ligase family protein, partial [Thermomicrobiales bacterium]|nr:Mur ligase family protein [Thermomicrobiales bacterium]